MSLLDREVRDETFEMGRVASRTFGTIGRNWLTFFTLALFTVVPQLVLSGFLQSRSLARAGSSGIVDPLQSFGTSVLTMLAALVLSAILQAALVHGTVSDLNGKKASFGDCLQTGIRTCLPVIGLSLVMGIALFFGFILIIVPGVMMFLAWIVAVPVLVVEKTGVFSAFGRSAELTKGHRWAIFGLVLVVVVIWMIIAVATLPLVSAFALSGGGMSALMPLLVINGVVSVVLATVNATGIAAIYYELRSIKEGIGPEQLAAVFD